MENNTERVGVVAFMREASVRVLGERGRNPRGLAVYVHVLYVDIWREGVLSTVVAPLQWREGRVMVRGEKEEGTERDPGTPTWQGCQVMKRGNTIILALPVIT